MDLEGSILAFLQDSAGNKRKAIVRHVQSQEPSMTKKQIRKALKKLVRSGRLVNDERKSYKIASTEAGTLQQESSNNAVTEGNASASATSNVVPIAEVLRRRYKQTPRTRLEEEETVAEESVEDIDEEIRRLEAELNAESDSEIGEDDDSMASKSDKHDGTTGISQNSADVICLSTLAKDRIEALPNTCLPANRRRVLKGIDALNDSHGDVKKKSKKRKRDKEQAVSAPNEKQDISEGLKAAVQDVLKGYIPRSNEKLPFYCRVCAKQYNNEAEFFRHKNNDFHKAAVEMEKKASYCKLCRKQLTSQVQLKEHLTSKPHRDRLQKMKSRKPAKGRR